MDKLHPNFSPMTPLDDDEMRPDLDYAKYTYIYCAKCISERTHCRPLTYMILRSFSHSSWKTSSIFRPTAPLSTFRECFLCNNCHLMSMSKFNRTTGQHGHSKQVFHISFVLTSSIKVVSSERHMPTMDLVRPLSDNKNRLRGAIVLLSNTTRGNISLRSLLPSCHIILLFASPWLFI